MSASSFFLALYHLLDLLHHRPRAAAAPSLLPELERARRAPQYSGESTMNEVASPCQIAPASTRSPTNAIVLGVARPPRPPPRHHARPRTHRHFEAERDVVERERALRVGVADDKRRVDARLVTVLPPSFRLSHRVAAFGIGRDVLINRAPLAQVVDEVRRSLQVLYRPCGSPKPRGRAATACSSYPCPPRVPPASAAR